MKLSSRQWKLISALLLPLLVLLGCQRLMNTGPQLAPVALVRGPYLQSVTPDGVTVVWETDLPSDSRVDYGLTPRYGFSVQSSAVVTQHALKLTGLEPYTMVHYRVSSNQQPLDSDSTFRTAAAPNQTIFSFVVFGDTRTDPIAHQQVVSSILTLAPDIVLHTGDFVGNGLVPQMWTSFFSVERKLLRQTPLYGAMGNHERESAVYFDAFYFPGNEHWYSFDYGNVHFVALDSEDLVNEQIAWLRNDLAQTRQPWKVVFFHSPLYSSGPHGGAKQNRDKLEPILVKYGVDLVICGHDHDYERLLVGNIVYIVTGGGGAPLYQEVQRDPHSAYFTSTLHSVLVAVNGLQLNIAGVRADGTRFDESALRKAIPTDPAIK